MGSAGCKWRLKVAILSFHSRGMLGIGQGWGKGEHRYQISAEVKHWWKPTYREVRQEALTKGHWTAWLIPELKTMTKMPIEQIRHRRLSSLALAPQPARGISTAQLQRSRFSTLQYHPYFLTIPGSPFRLNAFMRVCTTDIWKCKSQPNSFFMGKGPGCPDFS